MAENNKKRAGSFRKLFPNLFFSNKSKEKNTNKDAQSNIKNATASSKGNQYHNPRSIRSDKGAPESGDNERIYENLKTRHQSDNETQSNELSSHHSSSSTLVSESTKNKSIGTNEVSEVESIAYTNYAARPQVPRKPYNEMSHSPNTSSRTNQLSDSDKIQYPDVYYHSLEKLNDKISPLDEIEIYRASQAQAHPASVGAEIKRVSTKFLISPKKEAEVRTLQPTRARSLSFDNNKARENEEKMKLRYYSKRDENIKKPYNYSAPTSPMPINHKIPNMPKTVSPYEHVRKTMIETEEKRNSLSRNSVRNKSTPSPRSEYSQRLTPTPQDNSKQDARDKEKTRQKVEAFYWQKLKELKQKEDEFLIKQSLNSSLSSPVRLKPVYYSNCSTPNSFSFVMDSRSCSLPRGKDLNSSLVNQSIYSAGPFTRGAPERRTDTFIKSRIVIDDPEIIYRHPEKLLARTASPVSQDIKKANYYRGTIPQENRNVDLSKRVSFEEKYGKTANTLVISARDPKINDKKIQNRQTDLNKNPYKVSELQSRVPPRPPVRTTSVGGNGKNLKLGNSNKKIMQLSGAVHSLCSESESGSEAGEIQRILTTNAQKVNRESPLPSGFQDQFNKLNEMLGDVFNEDETPEKEKNEPTVSTSSFFEIPTEPYVADDHEKNSKTPMPSPSFHEVNNDAFSATYSQREFAVSEDMASPPPILTNDDLYGNLPTPSVTSFTSVYTPTSTKQSRQSTFKTDKGKKRLIHKENWVVNKRKTLI